MGKEFLLYTLRPIKLYLILYVLVLLLLWIFQSSINYEIGIGFIFITLLNILFCFSLYSFPLSKLNTYLSPPKYSILHKLVKLMLTINFFIILYLISNYIDVLKTGVAISVYRSSLFGDKSIKDYYGAFAAYLFFYCTIIPIFGISYGVFRKIVFSDKKILIISLILLTLKEVILVSRFYLFPTFLTMLLLLYCFDIKMTRKRVVFYILLLFTPIVLAFVLKSNGSLDTAFTNARNYLIVGYSLFSNSIDTGLVDKLMELGSPYAFLGIFSSFFYDKIDFFDKIQEFIYLGDAGYFNAFYTSLLLPYLYGGFLGSVICTILFGLLISYNLYRLTIRVSFYNFNALFSLLLLFFSYQFTPVQLTFFWDYFYLSLLVQLTRFLFMKKINIFGGDCGKKSNNNSVV
ncbi:MULTISPECIES: O-antigen polymerase [unclassified Citrobacter]|uniref:O-antigen polymerase n=1 Tax=unclassified Citrobacter TaxID=2644389 RepID=UPI00129A6855|nr:MULTISPECIES: O-antigen polymerase [unclassified Citrobacter]